MKDRNNSVHMAPVNMERDPDRNGNGVWKIKTSKANTESLRRKYRRLAKFDGLIRLGFLADSWKSCIREVRYKPCRGYNLFKGVKQ